MPVQEELKLLIVRPIKPEEECQWDQLMATNHYLGFRKLVGESLKYVAIINGQWVALIGWGTAAFKCGARDEWIGWSKEQQWGRLIFIANNARFLVLPWIHIPNLASKILSLNMKRLSTDWMAVYGHRIALAETFVDHSRFAGTCYRAAGWLSLGQTLGYGRNAGQYYYHGNPKTIYVYPLNPKARQWLTAPFLVPELSGGGIRMINLNTVNLEKPGGLIDKLKQLKDPRKRRGIRHGITTTLAIAACAVLAGCRSYVAIGEWASDLPTNILKRLGCRYNDKARTYLAPSEPTLRRHLQGSDAEELDRIVNDWLAEQADPDAIAVDGKTVRGSKGEDGKPIHLFSAVLHKEGVVVAQKNVNRKTNEITEFQPLIDSINIDLKGKVITADALHTQVDHARYLVKEKEADYLFTVKGNQGSIKKAIESLGDEDFSP